MSVMIQVRNVPDDIHRALKTRAAEKGMSLSEYCLTELEQLAKLPTLEEWSRMVAESPGVRFDRPVAEIVREAREDRWPS